MGKEAQEDSTKEDNTDLDDEEADALHIWGGPRCDPKNDLVSNSNDSDNLRSLEGSDDERMSKRPPTIVR